MTSAPVLEATVVGEIGRGRERKSVNSAVMKPVALVAVVAVGVALGFVNLGLLAFFVAFAVSAGLVFVGERAFRRARGTTTGQGDEVTRRFRRSALTAMIVGLVGVYYGLVLVVRGENSAIVLIGCGLAFIILGVMVLRLVNRSSEEELRARLDARR